MGNLKSQVQRTIEVFNDGNIGLIDDLYAPDFINRSTPPGVAPTREGFKQFALGMRKAFPDIHYTIDDSVEAGDKFVTRLTASGTMRGDFAGMPASGKFATWTEIHIVRVANEHVVEHWGLVDMLGMMVQLGFVAAPGQVPVTV